MGFEPRCFLVFKKSAQPPLLGTLRQGMKDVGLVVTDTGGEMRWLLKMPPAHSSLQSFNRGLLSLEEQANHYGALRF